MNSDKKNSRILGGAFLLQVFAPLIGVLIFLQPLIVGEDIILTLANIAQHPNLVKVSIVIQLFTVLGIGMIGALMYHFLQKYNKPMASIARLLYTIEATILAVSLVFLYALLLVSEESIIYGSSDYLQTLGRLFNNLHDYTSQIHMFFFAMGACLFYYQFLKTKIIPRGLAIMGMIAAPMSVIGIILSLLGISVPLYIFILSLPFELLTGLWLIIKGINRVEK
ncbi:MAG: DUF4386 domain-containing protein [Promethearchaeota archaeon]